MINRKVVAGAIMPLAVVATFLAALPWVRAFPVATILPVLALAAVISVTIPPAITRLAGRNLLWSAGASVIVFVPFNLLVVLHNPIGIGDLGNGFAHGTAHILSIALPVAQPRWLFVPAVTLCWLCGSVTSELLTRTRAVGLPSLTAIVGFGLSYAVTAGAAGSMVLVASLLGIVSGILLFLRRWLLDTAQSTAGESATRVEASLSRPLVLGSITLVVVVALCAYLVPKLPGMQSAPKAPKRTPPVVAISPVTPTVGLAELRGETPPGTPRTLFTVEMNKPSSGYLAAVDLDSYDGDVWSLDHTFEPTGGDVAVPGVVAPASSSEMEITQHFKVINAPTLPWMPFLDQPLAVSGLTVEFDQQSGMIVPVQPLADGESYSVLSTSTAKTLDSLTPRQLTALSGSSTPNPQDSQPLASAELSFQNVLTQLESEVKQTQAPTLVFLRAVENDFQTNYRRVPSSDFVPTSMTTQTLQEGHTSAQPDLYGTSLADIQGAVFSSKRTATPEQFATLMTLLARQLGIPARMVVGYRLSGLNGSVTSPGITYQVTNLDTWAWTEIYVPSLGWLVIDPTPNQTGVAPPAPPSGSSPPTTQPHGNVSVVSQSSKGGHAVAPAVNLSGQSGANVLLWILGAVVVVLLLFALVPGAVTLIKVRRRKRRISARNPRKQIQGAWLETLDALYEADVQGLEPLTNSEVSAVAGEQFGAAVAAPVALLASKASVASFSSDELTDPTAGRAAWSDFEQMRKALKAQQTGKRRLRSLLRIAPKQRSI